MHTKAGTLTQWPHDLSKGEVARDNDDTRLNFRTSAVIHEPWLPQWLSDVSPIDARSGRHDPGRDPTSARVDRDDGRFKAASMA
jgi:hypothetical protein